MKFVGQAAIVLEPYRNEVIEYITDPRTGLQRKIKFPPTIAEIVEACDEHARHLDLVRGSKPATVLPRREPQFRCNYQEMIARYGRPVGVFELDRELPYGG